jgi:hypothetical protein
LCSQEVESIQHLLFNCVYNREVWLTLLCRAGFQELTPSHDDTIPDWWLTCRKRVLKELCKGFDSFVFLVSWLLWKERNARVFNATSLPTATLVALISDICREQILVGFSIISCNMNSCTFVGRLACELALSPAKPLLSQWL